MYSPFYHEVNALPPTAGSPSWRSPIGETPTKHQNFAACFPSPSVLSHTRFKVAHSLTQPDPEENSEVPFEPYEGIVDKPKEDAEIVTNRKYTDFEIVNEQSIEFNHAAFGNHDEVEEVNERNKNKKVEPKYMREEQERVFFGTGWKTNS